ncbi:polyketide biosynthesis acyl carrier protein [Gammaproteobacteria bacterium]
MSSTLSKEEIFAIVQKHTIEVLPDLAKECIQIEKSLKDLGANSIDRMEIVVLSMESMGIKSPLIELAEIKNLEGLINFFYKKLTLHKAEELI